MGGFTGSSLLPGLPTDLRIGHTSAQEVQNQKVLTVSVEPSVIITIE